MSMPEPTDRQLRAAVYRVARTYLEVERGDAVQPGESSVLAFGEKLLTLG